MLVLPSRLRPWYNRHSCEHVLARSAREAGELGTAEKAFEAKNYNEAERILLRLATSGNVKAARFLGGLYLKGQGLPQDYFKARKWLEKAASAGQRAAMDDLAWMMDM